MTPPPAPAPPDAATEATATRSVFRLAVFSDIHGNLPGLRAVLADIDADKAIDAIWYGGDYVGYGPWPDECVQTIAARHFPAVSGNYDEKTRRFPEKAAKWEGSKDPRKFAAFRHAYENLSDASRAYLAGLPQTHRAEVIIEGAPPQTVLLTHIAPDSQAHGISPLTPQSRLDAIAEETRAHVIVTGHTHWPCARHSTNGETLFVNAGSSGRPGDGDLRAAYVVITFTPHQPPHADFRRVAYPIEEVIAALPRTGLPDIETFAALYREGRATF